MRLRSRAECSLVSAREELLQANRRLEVLAAQDQLTGLANRRRFDEVLEREARRAVREGTPLSLLLIDLDHFKGYNDAYGHVAGDACLQTVCRALAQAVQRPGDMAARYGGEEFVIVLSGFGSERARSVAERLRKSVSKLAPTTADQVVIPVTASFGVSVTRGDTFKGPGELLQAADMALYAAKRQGRNRVILHRDVIQGGAHDNKAQALTPCTVAAP